MIGMSAISILSSISLPWGMFSSKEIVISLMGLLFANGFLVWLYYILFVWRQRYFEFLEDKYKINIVGNPGGSFNLIGDLSILTKLIIHLQILGYYVIGILTPLALFLVVVIMFMRK